MVGKAAVIDSTASCLFQVVRYAGRATITQHAGETRNSPVHGSWPDAELRQFHMEALPVIKSMSQYGQGATGAQDSVSCGTSGTASKLSH